MRPWLVVLVLVVALAALGSGVYVLTRGIRNNNPGNIRHGAKWRGMSDTQTDKSFVQFVSAEWGIRAMARILKNYYARGLVSVRQIISTWAPPNENDTESYIIAVSKKIGVMPGEKIILDRALPDLIAAIIRHENGVQPYSADTIARGIELERTA